MRWCIPTCTGVKHRLRRLLRACSALRCRWGLGCQRLLVHFLNLGVFPWIGIVARRVRLACLGIWFITFRSVLFRDPAVVSHIMLISVSLYSREMLHDIVVIVSVLILRLLHPPALAAVVVDIWYDWCRWSSICDGVIQTHYIIPSENKTGA